MRVLLVASPMIGHVLPHVPVALALQAAGHGGLLATAADGVGAARRAGVPAHDVAPGLSMSPVMIRSLLRHPVRIGRMVRGDEGTDGVGLLFAAVSKAMTPGTVQLAEEWQPHLVLHEGLAAAGAIVAGRREVPGVLVDALLFDARDLFHAVARSLGRTPLSHADDALPEPVDALVAVPASLHERARIGRPMRYVVAAGHGDVPEQFTRRGTRPILLVSRSTVDDPRPDRLMTRVVDAARDADLDVVLVRPDRAVARRTLPPNVTTTDWLPFADVLPHVAGVVHHGGAGTLMSALAAGVPQIVVPGAGDRTKHSRLVAARGAGLAVPLDELTSATLERLATDPELRATAGEGAAEIATMPDPSEVVGDLEALVR
ncbi:MULTISPECIES: nucleotide disphospho-sugar-binding domain-containing protein [unclassified Modestobacter]|uniref:nucleotide disphospho-sugar-binding domain-containing protein n=1 Tax=unclassified Modestobacter TaxID=2643866 RepID=UPI0022AAD9F8|nr:MULTISPECIES: nucleotide disphospho-sugar-binding domain-containing protein [unclassified Modestobacter]MCZ2826115.1 glycosyltransferase [Modestobacter sp. VKM Ac-2981]MCZ2852820.1 glycosyltransferase [Modestobacter sp. VKM Ac-2982]